MSFPALTVSAFGEEVSVVDWAARTGLAPRTLLYRLRKFSPEVAVSMPPHTHADPDAPLGGPRSWTWDTLTWADDEWAQAFVARWPDGAELQLIADALGVSVNRVEQIQEQALAKLFGWANEAEKQGAV